MEKSLPLSKQAVKPTARHWVTGMVVGIQVKVTGVTALFFYGGNDAGEQLEG